MGRLPQGPQGADKRNGRADAWGIVLCWQPASTRSATGSEDSCATTRNAQYRPSRVTLLAALPARGTGTGPLAPRRSLGFYRSRHAPLAHL